MENYFYPQNKRKN